jgi:hypothetical protein
LHKALDLIPSIEGKKLKKQGMATIKKKEKNEAWWLTLVIPRSTLEAKAGGS